MNDAFTYQGSELELFQHAKKWKQYFSSVIRPFIKGDVLEAGAGIGSTTLLLNNGQPASWLLLEPDAAMCTSLNKQLHDGTLPANCTVMNGTTASVSQLFDTIIYIDVLEHIEADKEELVLASKLLKPGGHLIVLSPAFQHLYNPFDKAIGHFRRYTRRSLTQLTPAGTVVVSNRYYDTVGYFAALMNKVFLRQKYPALKQVLFWDRWLVPLSRFTDKLFFHSFGKSIITIWKKEMQ